ncbi:MAG: hypothetical protein Q9218_005835 [Villophora microphyllina]
MSKRNLIIIIFLVQLHLSALYALPAQPINAPSLHSLTPNHTSSSSTNSLRLPLFENVQRILMEIHNSPFPHLRRSNLLAVYASTLGNFETTTTVSALRKLKIVVFPPLPPNQPIPFLVDCFDFHNLVPDHYDQWAGPVVQSTQHWGNMDASIRWEEVYAVMGIEVAELRVKEAGYRRPFAMVQLSIWMGYPMSWCFKFTEPYQNIRVEVATGKVVEEIHGC